MGTWTFSPELEEGITTADTSGGLEIKVLPKSKGYNITEYTVTYIADNGCKAVTSFTIDNVCGDEPEPPGPSVPCDLTNIVYLESDDTGDQVVGVLPEDGTWRFEYDTTQDWITNVRNQETNVVVTILSENKTTETRELKVTGTCVGCDNCTEIEFSVWQRGITDPGNPCDLINKSETYYELDASWDYKPHAKIYPVNIYALDSLKCTLSGFRDSNNYSWVGVNWCTSNSGNYDNVCKPNPPQYGDTTPGSYYESNGRVYLWIWPNIINTSDEPRSGEIVFYAGDDNQECHRITVTQKANTEEKCDCTTADIEGVPTTSVELPPAGAGSYIIVSFTADTSVCDANKFRYEHVEGDRIVGGFITATTSNNKINLIGSVNSNDSEITKNEILQITVNDMPCEPQKIFTVTQEPKTVECSCTTAKIDNVIPSTTIPIEGSNNYIIAQFTADTSVCSKIDFSVGNVDGNFIQFSSINPLPNSMYQIYGSVDINRGQSERTQTMAIYVNSENCTSFTVTQGACPCSDFRITGETSLIDGEKHTIEKITIAKSSGISNKCKNWVIKNMRRIGGGNFIDMTSISIDSNGNINAYINEENNTGGNVEENLSVIGDECKEDFTVTQPPKSVPCITCSTVSEYRGVDNKKYIPRTGVTISNTPLGTINNSQCSGDFTFEGNYNWFNNLRITPNGEPRYLLGEVLENDATPNNRVATFTIKSASGVECGEIKVWQRGCDIEDIVSVYTESNPAENDGINPPREIGSFKKKKTCNVEFNLQPDKTWVHITDTTVSESGNYYVVHVFGRVLGNNESRSRTCNVNIRDNSDNFGLGIIEVYQSNI